MIFCLGTTPVYQRSMTFDKVALDGVNRAREVSDYASGKSINVARVLRALGREVLTSGFVGGPRGEMLLRDLDEADIAHQFVTVAAPTRQCVTVIDRAAATATELVEESLPVDEAGWRKLDHVVNDLLPRFGFWIFSGTLPPGAPRDFYARWLPVARRSGARVILDARGEPLRLALAEGSAIFKLNRDELAETLGQDLGDDRKLADALAAHTPSGATMIVTLGAGGAMGYDGGGCWRVFSPSIKAVSAVGSGDAFAAGLGAALSDDKPLHEALKLAAACGAANALTPWAGHLALAEVHRLLEQVRVEPLS